ncbi:CDP-alcohol phosphatidyltransferase family protein [Phosphitispora sp. TUW77]|uniref:CDP-alcohol phosphatidyltransferase family protein n=1 Tax=Phosphitispora sp. TUW77 TaxID=3152361 RepID=UPI003AB2415C
MINVPNIITIIRIMLVPVFLVVFWTFGPHRVFYGMVILSVAGITDIIDGYLARKLHMVTPLGKFLDPLADKLMVISVMTSLFIIGRFPLWLVVLVIIKELVQMTGSVFIVISKHLQVSANFYGKAATIAIYAALFSCAFQITGSSKITVLAGIISVVALCNYALIFFRQRSY